MRRQVNDTALCREIGADSLLTSDKYAASKAASLGVKTMTLGDVIKDAYGTRTVTAVEAIALLEILIDQNILNTGSVRELLREAKTWLQRNCKDTPRLPPNGS